MKLNKSFHSINPLQKAAYQIHSALTLASLLRWTFLLNLNVWVINKLQPTTTNDSFRTKMKNMSTTVRSNNSNNLSSLSSPEHMDFPSLACRRKSSLQRSFVWSSLHCHGELGHNCFLRTREVSPKAEKLVSGYKHGVHGCNVRSSIRSFVCSFKGRFSAMEYHTRGWGSVGHLLPSLRFHFLAGFVNFRSFYNLWKILRRLISATKTPCIVNKGIRYCYKCNLDTCYCCQRDVRYSCKLNFSHSSLLCFCNNIFDFFYSSYVCNISIFGENHGKMRTISSHQQNRTAQNQLLTRTLLFVAAAAAVLMWPTASLCNCRVFIECSQDLSSLADLLHHNRELFCQSNNLRI